ncbi:hypothetical protein AB0G37_06475, partial [Streptomyces fradiae]|uniref:hypothetical protein n=1 Tax=Streptomyces fradiae TaxID=1906 RepID=UPI0033CAF3AE
RAAFCRAVSTWRSAGADEPSTIAGEGAPGFGPGLDAARADAVLPVLDLLLGHRQPTEEECAGVPG